MLTGCFRTCGRHEDAVGIAGWPPPWFHGPSYKVLSPPRWLLEEYKANHDQAAYTEHFNKIVLKPLDPEKVLHDLLRIRKTPILLCYEPPGEFCHRRLVASWLEQALGLTIPEFIDYNDAM